MEDSPLSIAASVIGILTFVVAIILWCFAQAQSLRRLDTFDTEMTRAIFGATEFLREAKMLDEFTKAPNHPHSGNPLSSDITREVIVDMYKLGLHITLRIIKLLYSNDALRMTLWENEREEVFRQCSEMDRLRTKMFYSCTLTLSM